MLRDRWYLPHLESEEGTYFVTFRLAGTLPRKVLQEFQVQKLEALNPLSGQNAALADQERRRLRYHKSSNIQKYLDKGMSECWLKEPSIAELVKQSLNHFDGSRYISHAFCIMPDHVHWLLTPTPQGTSSILNSPLISIMHSIKSYPSHEANKILRREGKFWSKEYYDHLVRNSQQFGRILFYILQNPVKAGLCKTWQEWPWTMCSNKICIALSKSDEGPPEAGGTNH